MKTKLELLFDEMKNQYFKNSDLSFDKLTQIQISTLRVYSILKNKEKEKIAELFKNKGDEKK